VPLVTGNVISDSAGCAPALGTFAVLQATGANVAVELGSGVLMVHAERIVV
jgi:hypothetical protein